MKTTRLQKISLGIAGITALAIGSFILAAPQAFYTSYGIALGTDANLLSELRAPGANLAALGLLMLAGIVRQSLARVSGTVAVTVFLAFAGGRLVGLVIDGVPSAGILGALVIELMIGALCFFAFRPQKTGRPGTEAAFSLRA